MEFKNVLPRTRVLPNTKAHQPSWLENRPNKPIIGINFIQLMWYQGLIMRVYMSQKSGSSLYFLADSSIKMGF